MSACCRSCFGRCDGSCSCHQPGDPLYHDDFDFSAYREIKKQDLPTDPPSVPVQK